MNKIICIYCIYNLINNNCYIGSTIDFNRRTKVHLRKLNTNKHINKHLQRAWNKYGKENFIIYILKLSNKEKLLLDEQWCIDVLRPKYNICKTAGNTLGIIWSKERKIKQMLYLSNKSEEHKRNLSKALKENKEFIKVITDRCKILSENNKRKIIVTNLIDNSKEEFNSIIECSKALKINKNNIQSRLSKIVKSAYKNKYKFEYRKDEEK